MARRFYGSLDNRLEENRMFCDTIEVGTGMTEYYWSDCHAYEVVEVKDQKHVKVREYDHKHVGEEFTNNWELISNEENPVMEMVKRGNYWYYTTTVTADDIRENYENTGDIDAEIRFKLWLNQIGVNVDDVLKRGKVTRYRKANVSFGKAEYYYDYSF